MSKRVKSQEFLDTDSDDSDDSTQHTKKKAKAEKPPKKESKKEPKPDYWDLGQRKRVSISDFRGKKFVDIREYYLDNSTGEEKPGRKGIALNVNQWKEFMKVVKEVDSAYTGE